MTDSWLFGMDDATKMNSSMPRQQQQNESPSNWQSSKIKQEITKKFIPSPELIVDSSQSSESNENRHMAPVS